MGGESDHGGVGSFYLSRDFDLISNAALSERGMRRAKTSPKSVVLAPVSVYSRIDMRYAGFDYFLIELSCERLKLLALYPSFHPLNL
jgi:hypothetical protein